MLESEISFETVRPTEENARRILEWRNDPETLRMFFHRAPKPYENFLREFKETYFRFPDLPPVFALRKGHRVGFLRFNPYAGSGGRLRKACDISINIVPDQRKGGIGTAVLVAVQPFLRALGFDDLYAEVRAENTASRKAFEHSGFENLGETLRLIEDTGERALIYRFRARLCSTFLSEDRVFVVAEAGSNWRAGSPDADLAQAKALIDVAADAGADAVKFQTYRPETVYVENAGESDYLAEAGIKKDIRAIFADLAMPYEMIPVLADYCREKKILFMSTPFSPADFDAVDPFVSVHKIASYEISHLRLIEKIGGSRKPVILSTGASREDDIAWAVDKLASLGTKEIALMQCTSKYPAPPEGMNLSVIPWIKKRFGVVPGLSDHSRDPLHAPVAAVALGAHVIEKHFTLDNNLPGPDHAFAITPPELKRMVAAIRETEVMLGSGVKDILPSELELHSFARRGVQALCDIRRGEILREGVNISILRPGKQRLGIHPRFLSEIEGRKAVRDIPAGDGIWKADCVD